MTGVILYVLNVLQIKLIAKNVQIQDFINHFYMQAIAIKPVQMDIYKIIILIFANVQHKDII